MGGSRGSDGVKVGWDQGQRGKVSAGGNEGRDVGGAGWGQTWKRGTARMGVGWGGMSETGKESQS